MFDDLLERLTKLDRNQLFFVGIDGPGGVGKTTLAKRINEAIIGSQLVHMDDFDVRSMSKMDPLSDFRPVGPDTEWLRVLNEVILPLQSGKKVKYTPYDRNRDDYYGDRRISPKGLVIIEGVFALRRELFSNYDMSVWMECSLDIRLGRAIRRDGEASRKLWELDWIPMEQKYKSVYKPHEYAEFVYRTE